MLLLLVAGGVTMAGATFSISLEIDLLKKLQDYSIKKDVSKSVVIAEAIRNYLKIDKK